MTQGPEFRHTISARVSREERTAARKAARRARTTLSQFVRHAVLHLVREGASGQGERAEPAETREPAPAA